VQEFCPASVCPYAAGSSDVEFGLFELSGLGILGGSIWAEPGTVVLHEGAYGTGANGACFRVSSAASLAVLGTNTCGDAGAVNLAGTTVTWPQVVDAGGVSMRGAYYGPFN